MQPGGRGEVLLIREWIETVERELGGIVSIRKKKCPQGNLTAQYVAKLGALLDLVAV
jgi:hypothetical protein